MAGALDLPGCLVVLQEAIGAGARAAAGVLRRAVVHQRQFFWALAALPVVAAAAHVDVRLPRLRWAFYAYYPLHLIALWLIRIPMSKAGYLFF